MKRSLVLLPVAALALLCSLAALPATGAAPKAPPPPTDAGADAAAEAPPPNECIEAYEQVQALREQGSLLDARQKVIVCARDACPKVLAAECAQWLDQISQSLPSVVIGAQSPDGKDLIQVRVLLDGKPFAEQIGARAQSVDPGSHLFRFESAEHGAVELKVVIREGEKNRRIVATFEKKPEPAGPAAPSQGSNAGPIVGWTLGGVGLAGMAVGIVFEALGLSKAGELDSCKPACPTDETAIMSRNFVIGDVTLIAGAVALAAGVVVLIATYPSEQPAEPPTTRAALMVMPTDHGALGVVRAQF
jgi:hypothetical protein